MKPYEQEGRKVKSYQEGRDAEDVGGTALDEIAWGVAEALNKSEIIKAIAKYVEASAKQKKSSL